MNRDELWLNHSGSAASNSVALYKVWGRPLPPDLQAVARTMKKAKPEVPWPFSSIFAAVKNALMIYGFSGSGKSKLLGHDICFWNAEFDEATILIDPIGGAINWFLARVASERPDLEEKIIYCNMAGQRMGNGEIFVSSWPLLSRQFPNETQYEMATRYNDITARTEGAFRGAPIQGLSRFSNILTNLSMVLGSLGLPLLDAVDLLRNHHTLKWQERLAQAANHPDDSGVRFAVSELRYFFQQKPHEQNEQIEPLINRLAFLWQDEVSQIMFGNNDPTVNLDRVVDEGKIVLLDFSSAFTGRIPELRLFWMWSVIQEWAANRPANLAGKSLTLLMDELSYFTTGAHLDIKAITSEFNAFLQQRRRNSNIRFVGATQDIKLLPATEEGNMRRVVQQIPSQLFAKITDPDTAMQIAERYFIHDYDPYKVKQERIGFHTVDPYERNPVLKGKFSWTATHVSSVEFVSKEEQITELAQILMTLKGHEWLLAEGTGNTPSSELTRRIHLPKAEAPLDLHGVEAIKQRLARRDGIPVKETVRRQLAPKTALALPPPQQHEFEEVPIAEDSPVEQVSQSPNGKKQRPSEQLQQGEYKIRRVKIDD